jgi:hypothetical protein
MGAGKTTVLGEASDILTAANIRHAAIDLDCVAFGHFPSAASADWATRNLTAVWNNCAAEGVTRLLLSEAVDSTQKRDRLRDAIPGAALVVCRLRAAAHTLQRRVRQRDPGMLQEEFVRRAATLDAALDAARVEDFTVDNDDRSVTDVAREVLIRAGWIKAAAV